MGFTLSDIAKKGEFALPQNQRFSIGSGKSSDIVVKGKDGKVNVTHLEIENMGDYCEIKDLGRIHGTYVNNRPVEAGSTVRVESGDEICLGEKAHKYRLMKM
tara:strand:- start:395 stop:700 length:306 start_codon:yes stop_codon:yes gene_type:complete